MIVERLSYTVLSMEQASSHLVLITIVDIGSLISIS